MNSLALLLRFISLLVLICLAGLARGSTAPDTNTAAATPPRSEETNSQEVLRAYLQLQEQLHAAQLAIEQNRKDARETAVQSAEALAGRLQDIERVLMLQRARELETMQSSNRIMVIVAGSFAAVGFMAMMLMAYFQWRTVNGLAEISAGLTPRALPAGSTTPALGLGETHWLAAGPAQQSNLRLLGAMEQLEKRLYDLEHSSRSPLNEPSSEAAPTHGNGNGNGAGAESDSTEASPANPGAATSLTEGDRVAGLLAKGQSFLSSDKAEAALACFDEVLTLNPSNTEALVKKGSALERLQKLTEAIACYDQAIAADSSMTIAYLHKGGLFNRMERFNEALECYEKALQTQEKRQS
jgi:hypothetical protein